MRFAFVEARLAPACEKWLLNGRPRGARRSRARIVRGRIHLDLDELCWSGTRTPARGAAAIPRAALQLGLHRQAARVVLSHRNFIANTESIVQAIGLGEGDRAMAVLPFHYSFGASVLQTHLASGGAVVIDKRFLFPDRVLQRMVETRCTGFAGVPSHYQILLRKSRFKEIDLPT